LACAVVTRLAKQKMAYAPGLSDADEREAMHTTENSPAAQALSVKSRVKTRWAATTP
jgi:hypothetical protein